MEQYEKEFRDARFALLAQNPNYLRSIGGAMNAVQGKGVVVNRAGASGLRPGAPEPLAGQEMQVDI